MAELIRRRPDPGQEPALAAPGSFEEFTGTELSWALADTRWAADDMLDLAQTLTTKLPGTYAAFRTGVLRQSKVEIIARAVAALDPEEARAAEALVLDRAGRLTPGGLRAAINRAVIEVAPGKAAKRRKDGEHNARVERWPELSGNAGLAGRELPPAEVLAADQRISWWAKELKKAGLEGDMDQLRARAFLDIMLGQDSRPRRPDPAACTDGQGGPDSGGPDSGGSGPPDPAAPPWTPPTASVLPAGFAGKINLTTPLATLLDLAEWPGEIPGLGPIDPTWPATSPERPPPTPRPPGALPSPTSKDTPSATDAPDPNLRTTPAPRNTPDPARPVDPARPGNTIHRAAPQAHASPSPPPASPARPADTDTGG